MSKISKLVKKPKLFFNDFFKKNNLKKEFNFNSIIKFTYQRNFSIENLILYFVIVLTPFLFSYFYFVGRNKYEVSSSIDLRKSTSQNSSPDFNLLFAGLTNQAALNESKYFLELGPKIK